MLYPATSMKQACVHQLHEKYIQMLGKPLGYLKSRTDTLQPDYGVLLSVFAAQALDKLSASTALYHNVEHTILVCLVGQEILHGKHQQEGNVTCEDWLNFMVSLLCHDIGYVSGVCQHDDVANRRYVRGQTELPTSQTSEITWVTLAPGSTDASLAPYHVERSKLFVQENFSRYEVLDLEAIQQNIDFTQFPVPDAAAYQVTDHYAGLTRAADLIGQLSDPNYLQKTVALFYEFEELGKNQELGYRTPEDLKMGFPKFYRTQVYRYIQPALAYLQATPLGQQIVENLEANVRAVNDVQPALSTR